MAQGWGSVAFDEVAELGFERAHTVMESALLVLQSFDAFEQFGGVGRGPCFLAQVVS